jgi:predicted ester cyclase
MKLATSMLVVLVAVSGCDKKKEEGTVKKEDTTAPKVTEPVKKEEPPPPLTGTALADKYKACVAMINDAKWDEFRKDCVDDNYQGHAIAGMPEVKGADNLLAWFKDQKTAFPDWKLSPQLIMVSGRDILAVHLATGTHEGTMKSPMGDVPATKKKIGHVFFHRLKINDANKATDEWVVADPGTMMAQLGLAPKGSPAKRPAMDKGLEGAPIVVVTADDPKEKANMEAVKKGNEAFLANKPADLMATMADDAVEMDHSAEKDIKGKKEIEKGFTTFRNAWSNMKIDDVQMWAAGDYTIQMLKATGTNDKDMGKMKKTGKTVTVDVVEVMHFKDGKIDQMWRFMNSMDMAMQLGLMPAPGTAPAQPKDAPKGGAKDAPKGGAKDAPKEPAKEPAPK